MLNIPEIEARAAKATPGPCTAMYVPSAMPVSCVKHGVACNATGLETGRNWLPADADFDAHAREDIPALTALVRELAGALEFYVTGNECCPGCKGCDAARAILAKVQL